MREGRWESVDGVFLRGKTLGVVGTGNIGAEMIRLGKAIGMNVIAWTFHPTPDRAEALGVEYVDLDYLLSRSDVVSLHVQQTPETHHMIGKREIELMKSGALIVNVSRGAIIDTGAMVDALNSGHLSGAGLDVFEEEPLPSNHPLLDCQQIAVTPHVADMTPEGLDLLNEGVIDNVVAFFEGRPQNVVN